MKRFTVHVTFMMVVITSVVIAPAQTAPATAPTTAAGGPGVTSDDPTQAITLLRQELIDSFNKGDVDRLLSHLDPEVVITWQNAEVCRGPAQVRAYYDKMMTGPERRVENVSSDPQVDGRQIYGDWAVSTGAMNDRFVLTDGSDLAMNSRFTATIARRGNVWKVSSFHVSVNAFENPILGIAARKAGGWSLTIGLIVGLLIGLIAGMLMKRRRRGGPASSTTTAASA
jgi:ketosteroid isomerase-like protein